MKRLLLTTLAVFCTITAFAQRGTISGTILDADTREPLPGAVITIAPAANPDQKQFFTAAAKGAISVPQFAYGEYIVNVSFLGYSTFEKSIKIASARFELGDVELRSGVDLDAVVKVSHALRASQRGDTISYNAGSFRVANDADVEGLLKKMPGITVTDGTVEAQGEQIKKVLIDGKEFFGDDVTTAIRSLPAETVDRVEVFDRLSDAAQFSGMDDGEGYKALNIVTKSNMRQGQFGKLYAGYGYDFETKTADKHKYLAGGNVNIFSGSSRVTLLGLFNNVNQQNFSFEDIIGVTGNTGGGRGGGGGGGNAGQYMVRPQSGIASVNALGVNYSDTWGKKDEIKFEGSYFFNNSNTKNTSSADRWNAAPLPVDTLMTRGESKTESYNHRINARFEWKISDNQNLMIRPGFSFQSNDPISATEGWRFGESGYSRTDNFTDGYRSGYNLRTNAVYRAKLGKDGRVISLDGNVFYADRSNTSSSYSNVMGRLPDRPTLTGVEVPWDWDSTGYTNLRYLRNIQPRTENELRGTIRYNEPVSKYSQVTVQYSIMRDYEKSDRRSYITGSDFNNAGLTPDPDLSNSNTSTYITHRMGPGFRYSKERNTFIISANYQYSTLKGEIERATSEKITRSYNDFTYFAMVQWNINRQNSLRMFARSYTDSPDIRNLQSAFDISDAQNISRGNPLLNPSYSHNIRLHYVNTNTSKGRTFMWMMMMQNTSDYRATHLVANPGNMTIGDETYRPNYYSTPTNMDGFWMLRTNMSYGFPITPLKCNFNLMAGVNYSLSPSMLGGTVDSSGVISGGERNNTANMGYDFRAVLGSNISEKIDFTLSWNGTYNVATNSLATAGDRNRYFNHTAQANMKFVLPLGFTFTGSAAYTQYVGFTNNYEDDFLLCNVWLGKKVFKNQRGEVMVGVNDLLNQNRAFSRSVGSGWTQNSYNSVIGRYVMVQFTYNLRRFGKKGSTNIKDYEGVQPASSSGAPSGGAPMRMVGPPPAGGGFGR